MSNASSIATPAKIGPLLATFVVANNMIGSGFFLLPSTLAKSGGVTALAWLLGTALAMMLGAAFAQLARRHPNLEAQDDYIGPSLGRNASFLATFLYWVQSWIGNNAIAVAAFGYLMVVLPFDDSNSLARLGGQLTLIWAMFALNLLGPRPIARFQSFCVVFGLLPVAVILSAGWLHFDTEVYRLSWNVSSSSDGSVVFASLAPVFWAFVGLETGAMVAGVVRNPDRNVPIATLGGIAIAGVVYLISSVLMMGIVPAAQIAASSAPFALVAGQMFGAWAVPVIAVAAALKATGTLGGWMLVTGESGARAAQRGFLPAIFGRQSKNGAATWGLFIVALAMSALTIATLAPTVSGQFEVLIEMVVTLIVVTYGAAGLVLLKGSADHRPRLRERLLGIGALVACALLLGSASIKIVLGAVVLVLALLFAFIAIDKKRLAAGSR
jgi:amino acid transporter